MAEARKLTFEQTFAKCAIPQGVLSALGPCPAEVRVNKAARSMLVTVHADCTPDVGALRQAGPHWSAAFGCSLPGWRWLLILPPPLRLPRFPQKRRKRQIPSLQSNRLRAL